MESVFECIFFLLSHLEQFGNSNETLVLINIVNVLVHLKIIKSIHGQHHTIFLLPNYLGCLYIDNILYMYFYLVRKMKVNLQTYYRP